MPSFCVTFDRSMTYLPGHRAERPLQELYVRADDPESARDHAIRVTQGPGRVVSVVEGDPPVVSASVEVTQDRQEIFSC